MIVLVLAVLMIAGSQAQAQTKIGYISLTELVASMPDAKKADSSLAEYSTALNQNFEDQKREFNEQDSLLSSKDTIKYSKAILEIKRKNLVEMYQKLQGYQQQASQLYQQKRDALISPIQQKAVQAVQTVAKESGYTYVFVKDALLSSPPADDLLPLVKKKLGIK